MEVIKIVAIIYILLMVFSKIWEVFSFGQEREPYSPKLWLIGFILNLPIYWILIHVITQ